MLIKTEIAQFMSLIASEEIDIYNEFSLQHELGVYLRQKLGDLKVQFERNISYFGFESGQFEKREIDISIFSADRRQLKVAIELKFPRNGQYPEQMFSFCKDVVFLEQLRSAGFEECIFIAVADDRLFYQGASNGIYSYFRGDSSLHGNITKPTGRKDKVLSINGSYRVVWQPISGSRKYAEIQVG